MSSCAEEVFVNIEFWITEFVIGSRVLFDDGSYIRSALLDGFFISKGFKRWRGRFTVCKWLIKTRIFLSCPAMTKK
jgi:hypothetical protein